MGALGPRCPRSWVLLAAGDVGLGAGRPRQQPWRGALVPHYIIVRDWEMPSGCQWVAEGSDRD